MMFVNLSVGFLTIAVCVTIQCFFVSFIMRVLVFLEKRQRGKPTLLDVAALLVSIMMIMLVGNVLQITIWSGLFMAFGEFDDYHTSFYHSIVNFTALGYGDLVMSEERRLLGALEAANGVLMFGLTTSSLFAVLSSMLRRAMGMNANRDFTT